MNLRIRRKKIKPIIKIYEKHLIKCGLSGIASWNTIEKLLEETQESYRQGNMRNGSLIKKWEEQSWIAKALNLTLRDFTT